ncbi:hypothetical protein B0J11DRAFT_470398 [Dendryphion nanum]|uniref:FAD/NAD(P)-binding domain-containing protein n=1 Tax=Dendryphion nanum TaxID=256645 RepID=A0A9P9DB94_9PLEO|nr:hypothetical protein B0J11DRAFT_470398 [Dendryphion nanum]
MTEVGVNHSLPSRDRVEPGSVNIPLGEFPANSEAPSDAGQVADNVISSLNAAFSQRDFSAIGELFSSKNAYWRDHLALSWELRTLKGRAKIEEYLTHSRTPLTKVEINRSSAFKSPAYQPIDAWGEVHGVQFFISFETEIGRGQGVVRLAQEDGDWKIFTFSTTLLELKGYEEPLNKRRSQGVQHGGDTGRKNWHETREAESEFEDSEPKVLVIGAGQGGLTIAARLKMLSVPTLLIDSNSRVGDNWRKRYHQLVLHDPVWYDHLPYIPFPAYWPVFTPKDKLGDFFESYVKLLDLNVWTSTSLQSPTWDSATKQWTVTLSRLKPDGSTQTRTLHPSHIIQATGHSGKPNFPKVPGLSSFAGTRISHSSSFPGASPTSTSKKAVVIGSCNSGHDIAQDFYEKGYDVTMVQRSSTCVVSSSSITNIALKGLYDEDGPPTEDADIFIWGIPNTLLKAQQVKLTKVQGGNDKAILEGLEKAGFKLDSGPSDAGLIFKYFQRGGGYYIDVGASQLIIDGKIKIKQGQEITQIHPHGIEFADGTQLEADEIVFATGYQNMRTQVGAIFGDEVAEKVRDSWGLNEEGEFRTVWQDSGHEGLWFVGGNLAIARFYSRVLALRIKGILEGIAQ